MRPRQIREYGDFQTPEGLALQVLKLVQQHDARPPAVVVEPTCGVGSFVLAAIQAYQQAPRYYAFDIQAGYVGRLRAALSDAHVCGNVHIGCQDFFTHDWAAFFNQFGADEILVIGNPPWVTNAALSRMGSANLPTKTNFQGQRGLDASTGKANFDIAEWMLMTLLESLQGTVARLAMLCKTATARRVLQYAWQRRLAVSETSLHRIDARLHFQVAVEACVLITHIGQGAPTTHATLYEGLHVVDRHARFGLRGETLIANLDEYQPFAAWQGMAPRVWRSGLKHDAARVMELTPDGERFTNGLGETIELERACVFPLLKSSDIGNGRLRPGKSVLVTQRHVGESTDWLRTAAPKTWAYLQRHAALLDRRKSRIYQHRPRFSIFGIGDYSFAPWKVAISGLYKTPRFVVVGTAAHKPVMLDDTCYFLPCTTRAEADFIAELLNSEVCQRFLRAMIFFDAKRPMTKDILQRIDLRALAVADHREDEAAAYLP
jgi:hypothetical protein